MHESVYTIFNMFPMHVRVHVHAPAHIIENLILCCETDKQKLLMVIFNLNYNNLNQTKSNLKKWVLFY